MTLGRRIALYRKELGITQDALAQKLEVTNQAVSKWESDQSCPDIMLLPKLADIFGVSLDELFGREKEVEVRYGALPWKNDDSLHMVLYKGHKLLKDQSPDEAQELRFVLEGDALNVNSNIMVEIQGDVTGNVSAGGQVKCGGVEGDVSAGGQVSCGGVSGDVSAGGRVNCGGVVGDVSAGGQVSCGGVSGDVSAGGNVECNDVVGDVTLNGDGYVKCKTISGNVIVLDEGKVIIDR